MIGVLVTGQLLPELSARQGFAGLIREACASREVPEFVEIDAVAEVALPPPSSLAGVIITGSPASVMDEAAWMLRAMDWLRALAAARTPLLGICFGHQLLGRAFGGQVAINPRGREVGTTEVHLTTAGTQLGLMSGSGAFMANMSHRDTVLSLGPGAKVLARTAREPHAAVQFTETTLGLQFHPEFDGAVTRAYITAQSRELTAQGDDPAALIEAAQDTPESAALLRRWALNVMAGRLP